VNTRGRLAAATVIVGLLAPGFVSGAQEPFRFVDTAADAGLIHATYHGRDDKPHLLESGGAGVALLDYDGDGDLDLYLVDGWRLEGSEVVDRGGDRFYRNRGDGTFEDVTAETGLGHDGWGTAIAVGDIEGDGDPDLFLTNFGPDLLYRNEGDGTFSVVENGPGIDNWSSSSVFFDADGDGDEDLFVTGYIDATLEDVLNAKPRLNWNGVEVMMGPFGLDGLPNAYFINDGEGNFTEATEAAGLTDVGFFFSFGVVATDLDNDADLDLYVANDSNPNYVYENLGDGTFNDVGLWSGGGLSAAGAAQAGMGIAVGDYDEDGLTDLVVTHFARDTSTIYRNLGAMAFEDLARELGLREATYEPLQWGAIFADFDLDADLDLFIASGHIYPQADDIPDAAWRYKQTNQLLSQENGRFVDRSAEAGPGMAVQESSRGVAAGDVDNDGDIDLVVANVDAPPSLLRNDTARQGHWLMVDAPGARTVEVIAGDRTWTRRWFAAASYASASDPRFHVGLGQVANVDRIVVTWADGEQTTITDAETDALLRVRRESR
jgi:hypothetical protein